MPRTYKIGLEDVAVIAEARKRERDKQVDKRLHAVQLRGEGKNNAAIAEQLETSSDVVSRWVSEYSKGGVAALLAKKRQGNRRNMSYEEEAEIIAAFEKRAEAGQVVEVSEIEKAYREKVGHRIGSGQIYRVLRRHEWRKVKPRSRHPKKASPEAIAASKKLTHKSKS
jgi:transposase